MSKFIHDGIVFESVTKNELEKETFVFLTTEEIQIPE